ncbi:MAG: DUF554 domain-containing protein [Firmicutes bacterium]|nr:DUF554 domain-containing protein [Bacillota bacterium]
MVLDLFQVLQGSIVNAVTIIVGGLIGITIGGKLPERIKIIMLQGIALAVLIIGVQMGLQLQNLVVVIFCLIIGGVMGEIADLDGWLQKLGKYLEKRAAAAGSGVARAFVFTSLVYVVGAMAITGALESGLLGQHQTLYVKSILDGITAVAFAATMGPGVCLAAVPVFFYQGGIALAAGWVQPYLGAAVISEITGVGGLLIIAIGLNMLELTDIKVANFLPAFVVLFVAGILLPVF